MREHGRRDVARSVATSLADGLWFEKFCQTKVEDLCVSVVCDHDVVRLEITMHDSAGVCLRQSIGDLRQPFQQL